MEEASSPYGPKGGEIFSIVHEDGSMDRGILLEKGVPQSAVPRIENAWIKARNDMERSFIAGMSKGAARNDAAPSVATYYLKCNRDVADSILSKLQADFIEACGEGLGRSLFRALRLERQFGGFGRQDLRIKIIETDRAPNGWMVGVKSFEPNSGATITHFTLFSEEKVRFCFGDVFALPIQSDGTR